MCNVSGKAAWFISEGCVVYLWCACVSACAVRVVCVRQCIEGMQQAYTERPTRYCSSRRSISSSAMPERENAVPVWLHNGEKRHPSVCGVCVVRCSLCSVWGIMFGMWIVVGDVCPSWLYELLRSTHARRMLCSACHLHRITREARSFQQARDSTCTITWKA